MLVIRLFRVGKKNQPSFKIVVTDKRNPPRGGRFVEELGHYNPLTKEKILRKERIQYWLSQGVKPSPTVYNLFIREGILEGRKIPMHKKSKKPASAPDGASAGKLAVVPEAPKVEAGPKEEKPKKEEKEEPKKEEEKKPTSVPSDGASAGKEEKPPEAPKEEKKEEAPKKEKKE